MIQVTKLQSSFFFEKKLFIIIDITVSGDNDPKNRDLLRIPLLKDVFERYPTTPINIDVKENNDELIKQVKHHLDDE